MADHTNPSRETRAEEAEQARRDHTADRPPTPDEEAAAETNEVSDEARQGYQEMAERGAHQEGEGRLP
jgi:hypothetical protein